MAVVNPVIFQITGYQNSGKTTLIKKLIHAISKTKLTVVTIKHHGHGGKPDVSDKKDSFQHIEAGAAVSLVEGDGRLIIHAEKETWALEEKIKLLSFWEPDLILIEGHKLESFPKAVVLRSTEDLVLLNELENIELIFYWNKALVKQQNIPAFHIDDPDGYQFFLDLIKERHK